MVKVKRSSDYLMHYGTAGMKWGYNDGRRNGRRTASELKKLQEVRDELAKNEDSELSGSGDIEKDYDEANNMLKYLGISLDLHSDEKAVARTMSVYETMRDSKDNYKSQYEWLEAFSNKLAAIGYDMSACDKYLAENKDKLNELKTGTGSGESSKKSSESKSTKSSSSKKKSSSKSEKETKSDTKKSSATSDNSSKKSYSYDKVTLKRNDVKEEPKKRTFMKAKTVDEAKHYGKVAKYKAKSSVKHAEIQNGNELYHHGILGQKWGVRRYQNPDGSLTDAGRKKYSSNAVKSNKTVSKLTGNESSNFDARDVNKTVNTTRKAARVANKYVDKYENRKYRKKIEDMSDEELEREIQKSLPEYQARELRKQLERRYETVVGNPDSTKAGREKVLKALDVIGDVAVVAGIGIEIGKVLKK